MEKRKRLYNQSEWASDHTPILAHIFMPLLFTHCPEHNPILLENSNMCLDISKGKFPLKCMFLSLKLVTDLS